MLKDHEHWQIWAECTSGNVANYTAVIHVRMTEPACKISAKPVHTVSNMAYNVSGYKKFCNVIISRSVTLQNLGKKIVIPSKGGANQIDTIFLPYSPC